MDFKVKIKKVNYPEGKVTNKGQFRFSHPQVVMDYTLIPYPRSIPYPRDPD
jgi:hypothetical protein